MGVSGSDSRAHLHHLFRADEMLGPILLTRHNLHYYQQVMAELRAAIEAGYLSDYAANLAEEEVKGNVGPG